STTPGTKTQTWSLDGNGNWNTVITDGTAQDRTHSNVNEIATAGGTPYTYDDNGNLLDDGVRTYQWDALNRLRKVIRKSDGQEVASYTYDAGNRRVSKVVSNGGVDGTATNGRTDFYYDGWRVVEEHDGADAVTQQYVYGNALDEVWTLDN